MSRRTKLLIASLLACMALGAAAADAFVWHMSYGQAKNATKEVAKGLCSEDRECTGWGVGKCIRRTESGFACEMALFYPGLTPGEEDECDIVLHWGVDRNGYMVLKKTGRPHCHAA